MGKEGRGYLREGLSGQRQKGGTLLFSLAGKLTLKEVVAQGFAEIQAQFLGQLKRVVEVLDDAVGSLERVTGTPAYK